MWILQLHKETKVSACGKEHIEEDNVLRVFFFFSFALSYTESKKGLLVQCLQVKNSSGYEIRKEHILIKGFQGSKWSSFTPAI